jgi:tight adherence protein B
MNDLWIIYALVFGAALFGAQALYWILIRSRSERKIINRRLMLASELKDQSAVLSTLHRERGIAILADVEQLQWLHDLVMQSGLKLDLARLLIWGTGLTGLFYFLFGIWLGMGPAGLMIAIPVALLAGYVILRRARAKRIAVFSDQLPEALDIVVRGLRAGHPFRVALGLAAREMPDPIGTELGILLDEISFGLEQQVAVDHLYERVGQEDLSFLSTAINIQSQTGGNLADILQSLSRLLRNRAKLALKVRALTSEGRSSGILLSVLPILIFMVLNFLSPNYFTALKGHPIALPAIIGGVCLLSIGNFVIYRMVNFKV